MGELGGGGLLEVAVSIKCYGCRHSFEGEPAFDKHINGSSCGSVEFFRGQKLVFQPGKQYWRRLIDVQTDHARAMTRSRMVKAS